MKTFPSFWVRVIVSALFSLMLAGSAFSQADTAKPSIAVVPFAESGKANYGGAELTDLLIKELAASGKFVVADRAKSVAIAPEVVKSLAGTIDKAVASDIGQTTGAKFLVLGTVTEYTERQKSSLYGMKNYEGTVRFSLRVVDAATADILMSQTFEKRGVSMGEGKAMTSSFGSKAMQDAISKSLKDAVAALVKKLASGTTATD